MAFEITLQAPQKLPNPSELLVEPSTLLHNAQLLDTYAGTPVQVMDAYLDRPAEHSSLDDEWKIASQIPEVQGIVVNRILGPEAKQLAVKEVARKVGFEVADAIEHLPSNLRQVEEDADRVMAQFAQLQPSITEMQATFLQFNEYDIDIDQLSRVVPYVSQSAEELKTTASSALTAADNSAGAVSTNAFRLQEARDISGTSEKYADLAESEVDDDPGGVALALGASDAVANRGANSLEDHEAQCEQDRVDTRTALRDTDEALGELTDGYQNIVRGMTSLDANVAGLSSDINALGMEIDQLQSHLLLYTQHGLALPQIGEDISVILARLRDASTNVYSLSEAGAGLNSNISFAKTQLQTLQEIPLVQQYSH